MLIIAKIKTMTTKPLADTTAAVSSPDTALAMLKPAKINTTTSIRTAPKGVLMIPIIFMPLPLLLFNFSFSASHNYTDNAKTQKHKKLS
jgi:hypothetical protein